MLSEKRKGGREGEAGMRVVGNTDGRPMRTPATLFGNEATRVKHITNARIGEGGNLDWIRGALMPAQSTGIQRCCLWIEAGWWCFGCSDQATNRQACAGTRQPRSQPRLFFGTSAALRRPWQIYSCHSPRFASHFSVLMSCLQSTILYANDKGGRIASQSSTSCSQSLVCLYH